MAVCEADIDLSSMTGNGQWRTGSVASEKTGSAARNLLTVFQRTGQIRPSRAATRICEPYEATRIRDGRKTDPFEGTICIFVTRRHGSPVDSDSERGVGA